MRKLAFFLLFTSFKCLAYVPTVESLFRHGSNPDVTANGVALTLSVKKIEAGSKSTPSTNSSLLAETKSEDFYKLYFTKVSTEMMKVAQTRYGNDTFGDGSLIDKQYYSSFTSHTIKGTAEDSEKGIFFGMLRSIIFNDGAFILNYLKSLNIPVKLNNEIINRQKVEYLANYKQYLVAINKDRTSKRNIPNPLKPDDATSREKIDTIMNEPMYVDQKQVKLANEHGQLSWFISAGPFEATISQNERRIQRIKYKSLLGDYEILCKDYWLANGTHSFPRYIMVKDFKGESFQVEVLNMKHYLEKESDLLARLKKWDSVLKGKSSNETKPPFLL
jgi:hypothetical protein